MKDIEGLFKALADKNRIRILKLLESRKCCVCELADLLGITQPSISRHLKKLKKSRKDSGPTMRWPFRKTATQL
jgi:ArsR family transcriptional regulator, arsenate/arsenite/antimonite-responsive transcriptional repressor